MAEPLPPSPDVPEEFDLSETLQKGLSNSITQWIYDAMGGDAALEKYRDEHNKEFNDAIHGWASAKIMIDTGAALDALNVAQKITLLVQGMFTGKISTSKEGAADQSKEQAPGSLKLNTKLIEQMKQAKFADFITYWGTHENGPVLDGNRAIWTSDVLLKDAQRLTTVTDAQVSDWPKLCPFVPGTRVVLGKSEADVLSVTSGAFFKDLLGQAGIKLILVKKGDALTAPAADEIQVVSLQDPVTMNWDAVKEAQTLWDDTVPTQFQGAPQTLAAIQALEEKGPVYSTPEDICKKVGILTPDQPLLDFLKTVRERAPANPDAASIEAAKTFLTGKLSSLDALDLTKASIVKPGEDHFDDQYAFVTNPMNAHDYDGNASLKKEDVALFVTVPGKSGGDAELVALDASQNIIGFAS